MSSNKDIGVLYVDDEDINLFLFKASFGSRFQVITASSGPEGLKKLDEHGDEIVVVISDMNMPVMNGIQFIKQAKTDHPNLDYFILTGYDYNQEIDQALKTDTIQKFFTKPFNVDEIVEAVSQAFERQQG